LSKIDRVRAGWKQQWSFFRWTAGAAVPA